MNINTLVDRFLAWRLPEGTCADPCACNPTYPNRTGTNLLNAEQARQMFEHVLQSARQGWQPIETAPKDGTEILLFSNGDVGVCYWRNDKVMTGWTWGLGKRFRVPTHWMPLPAAPRQVLGNKLATGAGRDFFDCGDCPNITSGCEGRCIKGSTS